MLFNWLTVAAAAQTESLTLALTLAHPLLVNFISIRLCVSGTFIVWAGLAITTASCGAR